MDMSEINIGIAVKASKKLESKLSQLLNADGKGLHEKISSVESKLPNSLIKKLRYIASVRNKVVHEDNYHISDIGKFRTIAEQALIELEELCDSKAQMPHTKINFLPQILWLIVIFIIFLLVKCD